MTSLTFFFIFIPLLALILLGVNLILAPHNPYEEKESTFECGFHSFLGQNRTQFTISFFIFALLFLLFDLEILLVFPYSVSTYNNEVYGLILMVLFFLLLTIGFAFELGKNALKIDSRQITKVYNSNKKIFSTSNVIPNPYAFVEQTLKSGLDISNIITDLNLLLPQLASFINQFNMVVNQSSINVITDMMGNMSIDVPRDMPDSVADDISKKINIIDRLITTRGQEINDLLQKGLSLENNLKAENPQYVSQLTDKIAEFKRLNASYNH